MQAAIDQGRLPSTAWRLDGETVITLHPIQTPPDSSGSSGNHGKEEQLRGLRSVTRVFGKICGKVPPEQFFDAVDRVLCDA